VRPTSNSEEVEKKLFAKIYPDDKKALKDLTNYAEHVQLLGEDYSPAYQNERRYRGNKYSITISEIVDGPSAKQLTFGDMILSPEGKNYSLKAVDDFISESFEVLDSNWKVKAEKSDLIEVYLEKKLKENENRSNLESENNCHRWFGVPADSSSSLEEKIRQTLPKSVLQGTTSKIIHGDFHIENIMVRQRKAFRIEPVFIDFSRTSETHALVDIVTLEADLIIRGLNGIGAFSNKQGALSFLKFFDNSNSESINKWTYDAVELQQIEKVIHVIKRLRQIALDGYKSTQEEFLGARLLKTLEVLSYGSLGPSQSMRACAYVTYLMSKARAS
jgi:hypothetical protein